MKKLILSVLVLSGLAISENAAIACEGDVLPKVEQPTPVEKTYHLLDAEYDFKLFDHQGKLLTEGKSDKVDITDLKPGAYFLSFNGKTERLIVPGVAGS
jgi:hypothetical protein